MVAKNIIISLKKKIENQIITIYIHTHTYIHTETKIYIEKANAKIPTRQQLIVMLSKIDNNSTV